MSKRANACDRGTTVNVGIYCDSGINGGHEEMLKRFMLALISAGMSTRSTFSCRGVTQPSTVMSAI